MEENEVVMEGEAVKGGATKKIIIGIVALIAVILIIVGIVNVVRPTPEKTVKNFLKGLDSKKASKVVDSMDFIGMYAYSQCDGDYEDFVDTYNDLKEDAEDDEDDYKDAIDDFKDTLEEAFEDMDTLNVEIKKIKSAKKVKDAKNLYKVNAQVKIEVKEDEDDKTERDTSTYDFYVYKKSGNYYVVGIDTKKGDGLLNDLF